MEKVQLNAGESKENIIQKINNASGEYLAEDVTLAFQENSDVNVAYQNLDGDLVVKSFIVDDVNIKRQRTNSPYGEPVPKPPGMCKGNNYVGTDFVFDRATDLNKEEINKTTTINNLYEYPETISLRPSKGTIALKRHLRCLFHYQNMHEITVTVDMGQNQNQENVSEKKQSLSDLFETVITIKRDENGEAVENPSYYCYYAISEDDVHTYYLRKVKYELIGGAPSIARWMGVIAGTFVVAASALVPRFG